MGRYEVQVLDSYNNRTYADGHAAAIYAQYPPLVNVCRAPGEWQSYDIIFRGPRFNSDGTLGRTARVTLLHNGVLVQDNVELTGPSGWQSRPPYEPHPEKAPIKLQDHGNPVRFRNIWIRELPEPDPREHAGMLPKGKHAVDVTPQTLDQLVGRYGSPDFAVVITCDNGRLFAKIPYASKRELFALSETEFSPAEVDARYVFRSNESGHVDELALLLGGDEIHLKKSQQ